MPTIDLNTGIEHMDPAECWELLAGEEVGRVVVVFAGQPEIFPVNYVVDAEHVLFRTDLGTKLTASIAGPVVFEVDHLDREHRAGWSVILRGRASHVRSDDHPALRCRVSSSPLTCWLRTSKQHLVQITPSAISGRRIQAQH